MSDLQTPRLGLPYLAAAQAQKHVTLNTALSQLDALVQPIFESRVAVSQPESPVDGSIWCLPDGAAGANWTGHEGDLARFEAGVWSFLPPKPGQVAFVRDEQRLVVFGDHGWISLVSEGVGLRNRLINGDFTIWQRGETFLCRADQSTFSADRWQVWSAGGEVTASRQSLGLPIGITNALIIRAGENVSSCAVSQTIESAMISDLSGKGVTLSGWIYHDRPGQPRLNLYGYAVTDSSASRAFNRSWDLGAKAPGWSQFSLTFELPTGLVNGGKIEISFGSVPSSSSVGLAGLQLEYGTVATRLDVRAPSAELEMCRRFFQVTDRQFSALGGWISPTAATMTASLHPPMRTTPSCFVPKGEAMTVACLGDGISSAASVDFAASPSHLVITMTGLNPARTTGFVAGCLSPIACEAEL